MLKILEGKINPSTKLRMASSKQSASKANVKGKKIGIVASRFNEFVTKRLLDGALSEFRRLGVKDSQLVIAWVPGSFEIPLAAERLAKRKDIDAVIGLGAVIRGETLHFDLVAQAAARGIAQVGLKTNKPVIFGVLTTDTVHQAMKRSHPKGDNKGREAAANAIEMIDLLQQL